MKPNAAGLDIGSVKIWVCVPEDRGAEPVQPFGTFILDLYALGEWLATLPKPRQDRLCWKGRRMPLSALYARSYRSRGTSSSKAELPAPRSVHFE